MWASSEEANFTSFRKYDGHICTCRRDTEQYVHLTLYSVFTYGISLLWSALSIFLTIQKDPILKFLLQFANLTIESTWISITNRQFNTNVRI